MTCGNTVPEVGLELHSSPCKHWEPAETCGVLASPKAVWPSTGRRVWTLSTPPFRGAGGLPGHKMLGNLGGSVRQVDSARGDSDDEVEASIRGELMSVTVDPKQQHHERPRSPFGAINDWMEPCDRLQQCCRLYREFGIGFRAHDCRGRPDQCRGQQPDITDMEAVPIDYLKCILNVQVRCHASSRRFSSSPS